MKKKRTPRTGNHTWACQWLYVVSKPIAPALAFLALLWYGLPWPPAAILAGFLMPVKIGITGNIQARFREIRKTSPGLELPIPLAYLPGAYYLEQAIHAMLWPFRIRWIGSGKTEWFLGLPGVVGLVVYIIIGSYG